MKLQILQKLKGARQNLAQKTKIRKMQENVPEGLYCDTANTYVLGTLLGTLYLAVSLNPNFLPLSLPHPAPPVETLK